MAFITLGTGNNLIIKVPTIGTTDWADVMRTDTFLLIAQHDHTGLGMGDKIDTGALATDAVTGAKIRLDNVEYLKGRNAANSANINIIQVNANDKLAIGTDLSNLAMIGNTFITGRNNADSAYIDMLKVNTSDKLVIGTDVANLAIINDTYIQARNNADSGYISIAKVNTSDKIEIGVEIASVVKLSNNVAFQHRNQADAAYVNTLKLNASDKIELGATVVAVNADTLGTSLIDTLATAVTLADNQSAITAGVVTLSTDESCAVHYRLVRNGVTQSGVVRFTDTETIPSESYTGTDVGVTFTVSSGALFYATTSTGNTASMTYVVIKE